MNSANQMQSVSRRPTDPPTLWISVLAGSVLIHVCLLLVARFVWLHTARTQIDLEPISVELIQSDPNLVPAQPGPSTPTRPTTPATPDPQTPSTASPSSLPSPDTTTSFRSPTANLKPPVQSASPRSISSPLPRSTLLPTTPPSTQPTPAPSNSQPISPTPQPSPLSSTLPSPSISPIPQPNPSLPATSGEQLPAVPDIPTPSTLGQRSNGSDNLAQAPTDRNPAPVGFSARISARIPEGLPDLPGFPAEPEESTKTFRSDPAASGCLVTPQALQSFGHPVILRVAIDDKGTVTAVEPQSTSSSGNPDYDALATCAIKSWKFNPAYNIKDGERFYVYSNLDVQVILSAVAR